MINNKKKCLTTLVLRCVKGGKNKRVMEKGQPTEVEHEGLEDRQHLGTAPQTDGC